MVKSFRFLELVVLVALLGECALAAGWLSLDLNGGEPARRIHQAGAVVGNSFLLFGGVADVTGRATNDLWSLKLYPPSPFLSWLPVEAPIALARHRHSAVAVNGALYIYGGAGPPGFPCLDSGSFLIRSSVSGRTYG